MEAAFNSLEASLDDSITALETLEDQTETMNGTASEMENVADGTASEIQLLQEAVDDAKINYDDTIAQLKRNASETRTEAIETLKLEDQVSEALEDLDIYKEKKRRKRKAKNNKKRIHFRHIRSPDDEGTGLLLQYFDSTLTVLVNHSDLEKSPHERKVTSGKTRAIVKRYN